MRERGCLENVEIGVWRLYMLGSNPLVLFREGRESISVISTLFDKGQ